jgi:hypothetical protein
VLGLVAGGGSEHPGDKTPGRGAQVDLSSYGGQLDAAPIGQIDDVFQLAG